MKVGDAVEAYLRWSNDIGNTEWLPGVVIAVDPAFVCVEFTGVAGANGGYLRRWFPVVFWSGRIVADPTM